MPQKSFARKQFVLNLLGALAVIWAPHVLAVYDASTNTETLTDLMISRTRSDTVARVAIPPRAIWWTIFIQIVTSPLLGRDYLDGTKAL